MRRKAHPFLPTHALELTSQSLFWKSFNKIRKWVFIRFDTLQICTSFPSERQNFLNRELTEIFREILAGGGHLLLSKTNIVSFINTSFSQIFSLLWKTHLAVGFCGIYPFAVKQFIVAKINSPIHAASIGWYSGKPSFNLLIVRINTIFWVYQILQPSNSNAHL